MRGSDGVRAVRWPLADARKRNPTYANALLGDASDNGCVASTGYWPGRGGLICSGGGRIGWSYGCTVCQTVNDTCVRPTHC